MVEQKPSKLTTRVRFPSPAPELFVPVFSRDGRKVRDRYIVAMSCSAATARENTGRRPCGSVVEHSLGKGEVASPILAMGTKDLDIAGY